MDFQKRSPFSPKSIFRTLNLDAPSTTPPNQPTTEPSARNPYLSKNARVPLSPRHNTHSYRRYRPKRRISVRSQVAMATTDDDEVLLMEVEDIMCDQGIITAELNVESAKSVLSATWVLPGGFAAVGKVERTVAVCRWVIGAVAGASGIRGCFIVALKMSNAFDRSIFLEL